jgi:hypothetical protein
VQASSNVTNSGDMSTPMASAAIPAPGSLTAILTVSLIFCVALTVGFHQLGAYCMEQSIARVDADGFMVIDERLGRFGELFYSVAIFFAAPSGLFGFLLAHNLATKSATDRGSRLDSLGKAFWGILAIACVPIALMCYDALTLLKSANPAAMRDRTWFYELSGIVLPTLAILPFSIRERSRVLRVKALLKQPAAD